MDDPFAMHQVDSEEELSHYGTDLLLGKLLPLLQVLKYGAIGSVLHDEAHEFVSPLPVGIHSLKLDYVATQLQLAKEVDLIQYKFLLHLRLVGRDSVLFDGVLLVVGDL
jgi:hypothetical protein